MAASRVISPKSPYTSPVIYNYIILYNPFVSLDNFFHVYPLTEGHGIAASTWHPAGVCSFSSLRLEGNNYAILFNMQHKTIQNIRNTMISTLLVTLQAVQGFKGGGEHHQHSCADRHMTNDDVHDDDADDDDDDG